MDRTERSNAPRAITVVVTTYNQPEWLQLVLSGFSAQTDREFQLVVADDGSGPETARVVRRFETQVGTDLLHVRHEDLGFRKTVILNRAIRAAGGEYLIFTDGDCIPRRDFVAVHRRLAEVGRFLSGMAIRLSGEVSQRIRPDDVISGRAFRLWWLRSRGARPGRRAWKLLPVPGLGALLDLTSGVTPRFDGGNASAWRRDLEKANGFDNRMGYGLEDQSLGWRLTNMGVRGKQIRNRAVCLHLDHERPYRDPDAMRRHAEVRDRIVRDGLVRAPSGLEELDQIPGSDGADEASSPPLA